MKKQLYTIDRSIFTNKGDVTGDMYWTFDSDKFFDSFDDVKESVRKIIKQEHRRWPGEYSEQSFKFPVYEIFLSEYEVSPKGKKLKSASEPKCVYRIAACSPSYMREQKNLKECNEAYVAYDSYKATELDLKLWEDEFVGEFGEADDDVKKEGLKVYLNGREYGDIRCVEEFSAKYGLGRK